MEVKFLSSAARHGFTQADALSAIAHAQWVKGDFDISRVQGNPNPTLWVGPALDGTPIEVMTFIDEHGDAVFSLHGIAE
ncbi:hypothetical protein [Bifidobacterium sp. ESL0764]|uniref:hypothetical protein n=1 Tax=Bifidobacterium sp. ESL0764 TaxID=2983228 RepID=UPI0023F6C81C|nr:hypothetical protein [Bifidobacterium sp. ESL0764]WEV66100.1 hypothetical protein OZX71_01720 [Bifidobacterium sp. ESL0764]